MATRYNDIIKLRGGKAAYSITDEKNDEWATFIPNEQFNNVLRTVLKSVRANDIDNHKSFWINGTYGTGKSHAVSVISHLLGDDIDSLRHWIDYEYKGEKFDQLRSAIYSLRKEKRLLTVKLKGLSSMTHSSDLALALQKEVVRTLCAYDIKINVHTDFQIYIEQIERNPEIWDHFINTNTKLSSIASQRQDLIENLSDEDIKTYHAVSDVLREAGIAVRMDNSNVMQWFIEVQNKLRELGTYNGLLIIWDEFTDVMTDAIGVSVLKELQSLSETFMNVDNDSYLFLISHPSAFDKLVGSELMKQTDGRYHRMKYNMESVSAFKIMSRKFEVIDDVHHSKMCQHFYTMNPTLLNVFIQNSNDQQSSKEDLYNLFPLHPATANLATHYATVVGSSSRSVFEFLGQNDAIRDFLDSEECFLNRETITVDYLWNYVLKVFQEDVQNYGAVTERYNSYEKTVEAKGDAYFAVFKGVLLLNAFNNVSGENNNGLVTPSENNIHLLFDGTRFSEEVDSVLEWFNTNGIIQRLPGGLFSVQFSALPSGEIEEKKTEMRLAQYNITSKIIEFASADVSNIVSKKMLQKVIRPYEYKFYSDTINESSLRSQIKNGRKQTKTSSYFFAFLVARDNNELGALKNFAEKCSLDSDDKELKNIVFIVVDAVFGDSNYDRFIEFQANYACANSHGFLDQSTVHRNNAIDMVKEWMESICRDNATIYINGEEKQAISMKSLSSIINSAVTPLLYPYSPEAHSMLRQKAPSTFWKIQNSKEMVRTFLFATSISEFQNVTAQMRPIVHLLQDCLDENLEWKSDVEDSHPFKKVFDKVNSVIKNADKTLPFNFDEKLSILTKSPYGLYSSYAAMGMLAFSLRPWVNKIFDLQGKPRDANAMVDDIVMLFKVWDEGKSRSKLTFKFQTPEEGKLCKELVSLFGLSSAGSDYKDVTSLKDARYAITGDFLLKKDSPLWVVKYTSLPFSISNPDSLNRLVDNIVTICSERDLRNPSLINETLQLIDEYRMDMKNVLNIKNAFVDGFNAFLMQIPYLNCKESEIDEVKSFIRKHLESSVGLWTEEEVISVAKNWGLSKSKPQSQLPPQQSVPTVQAITSNVIPVSSIDSEGVKEKQIKARKRISELIDIDEAKALLVKLCESDSEWVLDILNN